MTGPCSIPLLEATLAGNLPADEEAAVQRHLEECSACAATLEQLAGGDAWRQEAAALLTVDAFDRAVPVREEWSEVDFTVEHLEPADEPNVLGRLAGYDILEILGRGGMGVVLKAHDRELKRCVAIKVLAPHLAHSSLAKKRFAREAQAAAAVVHPHVLAIHHVQPNGPLPFLVMPLVAGESLAERLKTQGTLELKEILRIGMQAAAGLAAAHDQGLVHRDVKPANILLEMGIERAVLTDFGLARAADDVSVTRSGTIAGTPQYMSPEQAKGEPLDCRSDLFSLGCVLYEMATGVSPFRADSAMATMRRLVDEAPQALGSLNPELPPWFSAIVDRLLEKEPSRRFGSAREVSEILEGCLAHLQQPASVPLPAALPQPVPRTQSGRRKPLFIAAIAMFVISAISLLGWTMLSQAPDIAGQWTGDGWGTVVLKKSSATEYTGTYTDTLGKKPGEIRLQWSRIEGRFNGTWQEGEDRFGELSVRLVGSEIRGALTTDAKSKINPATPRLADLTWVRANAAATPVPGKSAFQAADVLLHIERAKALEKKERWEEASVVYREVIRLDPNHVQAQLGLANMLYRSYQVDEAIAAYRRAIQLSPNHPSAHQGLGKMLRRKGEIEESIAECRIAIGLTKNNKTAHGDAYAHLGIALRIKGELDEAIKAGREAIKNWPTNWTYLELGLTLEEKGLLNEAIASHQDARRLTSTWPDSFNGLARALAKNGQRQEAITVLKEVVSHRPSHPEGHINLGRIFATMGDRANCVASYQTALLLKPISDEQHNGFAWILANSPDPNQRDPKQALIHAKKAVDLNVPVGEYRTTLGVAHYRAGDWKAAVESLNQAIKPWRQGDSVEFFFLAMAHGKLADKDQARSWYDKGVQWMDKNAPNDAELRRFRAEAAAVLGIEASKASHKD